MTDGILLVLFGLLVIMGMALLASALSDDAGYVLVVWHQWQIQTSVGFTVLLVLLFAALLIVLFFVVQAIFFSSSTYYEKRKALTRRKTLMSLDRSIRFRLVSNFPAAFVAMEDSLMHNSLNLRPFNKKKGSALHLLQADIARQAGLYPAALAHLNEIDSDDHELAALLRVRIFLESKDYAQAQALLDVLLTYSERGIKEPVRESLQPAFDHEVAILWSQLACQHAWDMLLSKVFPDQKQIDWTAWLKALSTQPLPEDSTARTQRLLLWMLPETQVQHIDALVPLLQRIGLYQDAANVAQHILKERLDAQILDQWMTLCLAHQTALDASAIESLLSSLEQRYPAQPDVVLARARWLRQVQHSWTLDGLSVYPDHALIQHYLLRWRLEDDPTVDQGLRQTLLRALN